MSKLCTVIETNQSCRISSCALSSCVSTVFVSNYNNCTELNIQGDIKIAAAAAARLGASYDRFNSHLLDLLII